MKTRSYPLFGSALATLLCVSLITGCSSPSSPAAGSYTYHAGATFTFKGYEIDSLGNYSLPSLAVDSVEAAGLTISGMTNVSRILERVSGSTNPFMYYIAYKNNGDFAIGDSGTTSPGEISWFTCPAGSRKTIVVTDTMLSQTNHEYEAISYIGQEMVTIPAGTFNAIKIEEDYKNTDQWYDGYTLISTSRISTDYIWYAPQLGMYVKIQGHFTDSTKTDGIARTTKQSGNMLLLDSYK